MNEYDTSTWVLVGGWFQICFFNVHPENWGRFSPILTFAYLFKGVGEKPPTRNEYDTAFC